MTGQGERPDSEPATEPVAEGLPPASPPPAAPATPLVAWEAPTAQVPMTPAGGSAYEGGAPPFTVGALLSDTFARYGADFVRLFAVSAAVSVLSWLGSFAVPMGSNPFVRPTGFVDVGGILGLLSFVAGIVGSSTMLALAEGGRGVGFGRAIRRGVERAGWLFLTSILMGVAFIALFLLALIPIGLIAVISPVLIIVPIVALFLVFLWAGLRLTLALPANVADNLNSIEALKLSWRVTKPTGVWLRLLGTSLLLGLMVLPAAFGAILLVVPAMFGGGAQLALLLVPAVAFSLFTPLSLLVSYSAYRRLVPPIQPSWTASPTAPAPAPVPAAASADQGGPPASGPIGESLAPESLATELPTMDAPAAAAPLVAWGDAAAASPAPTIAAPPPVAETEPVPGTSAFRVPRMGTAAKALIALIIAFDVAGIAAIPYGIAELSRLARDGFPGFPGAPGSPGFPGFPGGEGFVRPGQVAFGTDAELDRCTIVGQLFFATSGTRVEFLAALDRRVTPQDEVFLRITRDGQELETTLQEPGTYDCLGSAGPEPGLVDGVYTYEVIVNGAVSSTGSLIVQ